MALQGKRPSESHPRAELLDRLLGGEEAKLMYTLEFLDHLLGGSTAKTTLRIPKRLKRFVLFARRLYRENDPPKILEQKFYHVVTEKTDLIPRKRPFEYREHAL